MDNKEIESTMNYLIDYLCERDGVRPTIRLLYEDCGWTTEELHNEQFEMCDIDCVLEEISELKDDV